MAGGSAGQRFRSLAKGNLEAHLVHLLVTVGEAGKSGGVLTYQTHQKGARGTCLSKERAATATGPLESHGPWCDFGPQAPVVGSFS